MIDLLDVAIDIPEGMRAWVDAAITRVGYAQPDWTVTTRGGSVVVRAPAGTDATGIRREILFAVYREKILSETMDMRRTLLEAVTRR